MKALEGTDIIKAFVDNYMEENNIPNGPELPEKLELEYSDGSKEILDTTPELDPDFDLTHEDELMEDLYD